MWRIYWPYSLPLLMGGLLLVAVGTAGVPGGPNFLFDLLAMLAVVGLAAQITRGFQTRRWQRGVVSALSGYSDNAVCVVDREGRIVSVNAAAADLLGLSGDETNRKVIRKRPHLHALDGEPRSWIEAGLAGSVVRGEGTLSVPRGDMVVTYTAGPVIANDEVTGAVLLLSERGLRETLEARRDELRYRSLVESAPDGMILTDEYGYILLANARAAELHGCRDPDDLVGRRMIELVSKDMRVEVTMRMRRIFDGGPPETCEYSSLRQDGDSFPAETGISRVDAGPHSNGLLLVIRDISRHKQAAAAVEINRERASLQQSVAAILALGSTLGEAMPKVLQALAENGGWDAALFWQLEPHDNVLRMQFAWTLEDAGLSGYVEYRTGLEVELGAGPLGRALATRTPVWVEDAHAEGLVQRGREAVARSMLCFPLGTAGETQGVVEFVSREVSAEDGATIDTMHAVSAAIGQFIKRKQAERELEYRALHDTLTGLPNRALFDSRLDRALSVSATTQRPLAVLLMDVDGFKEVNDTFGHLHGDALLQQTAARLRAALRDSDTVARLGGDEFAVLLPSTGEAGALVVARKILQTMEQPFMVEGVRLEVGLSVGVSLYPDQGEDGTALLKHADVAMYQAKRGKLGVTVYAPQNDENTPGRFALKSDLRGALEKDEIFLIYQPKMAVRSGEIEAVEALARWNHPVSGLIRPDEFIPLAERTGLIWPLTVWVLREGLKQIATWRQADLDLRLAINLSAQSLHHRQLVPTIQQALRDNGIEPDRLIVEVTESSLMVEMDDAKKALAALSQLGVHISIDDFGTGYSSLSYLTELSAQEIKIDRSFVVDMRSRGDAGPIVRSVIELGHELGLQVVAEGVEDAETYEMLAEMNCDQIQGYYLSPPLAAGELDRWLAARDRGSGRRRLLRLDSA